MKSRLILCGALLIAVSGLASAQGTKPKEQPLSSTKSAKPAAQAMDPKAMEEMMAKMAAPGPNHERFKKMAGDWNLTVKWTWDPSQPMQTTTSTSTITTLMDGRYCQEHSSGEMMGKPFEGMGLTGYDNVLKKFKSVWIDNAGTGIMSSEGTPDASGNVVNWIGESSDPVTGKMAKMRMVTRYADDNHFTFEMYVKGPDGKEYKSMEIAYERKM